MAVSSVVNDAAVVPKQKLGTAELLFRRADAMGLSPDWVTPRGLFAVRVGDREEYVNFARSPLNSHSSASLAKNKYLTRRILDRHGMRNIPFMLPSTHAAAVQFLGTHRKIIAKPVSGSGAHDIHIITTADELMKLNVKKYIIEKYISGKELRCLVLNNSVIGVHLSEYGTSVAKDRALKRISYPMKIWDEPMVESALHVAHVLGLKFAAVDFIVDDLGRAYILEVNSAPGLKWFHAPTSGPVIDVAGKFLEAMFQVDDRAETEVSYRCAKCGVGLNGQSRVI